jgi:pyruvate ferredoxin oxidoreductase gamma subunit
MSGQVEIRIHGRGGQGNVVAAYLLAAGAIRAGFHAQAFPAFGAERRGAPVTAFVRIRETPIRRRAEVEHPDFLVVQDAKLLDIAGTTGGLAERGGILVNAETAGSLAAGMTDRFRVVALPASRIAEEALGRRVPNVPLIAALLALTGIFPLDAFVAALIERFDAATAAANRKAAEAAFAAVPAGAWRTAEPIKEVA